MRKKKETFQIEGSNVKDCDIVEENTGHRCSHCSTEMKAVKAFYPILFGSSLKYVQGEAFYCPSCQKTLLAWYQFREIEKKIRVEWEKSFGTQNAKVCHNCLFQACRSAYLDFFCIHQDSPFYMQKSELLQTQRSCLCFEYCGDPAKRNYLESPNLILRKFRTGDAEKVLENFGNREVRMTSSDMPAFSSVAETRGYLSDIISRYSDTSFKCWCVCKKEDRSPVGMISARLLDDKTAKVNWVANKEWIKTGELSEACWYVLDYLFGVMDMEDIQIYCSRENEARAAVMNDFTHYEINMLDKEKSLLMDSFWYSIHKNDWHSCFEMM